MANDGDYRSTRLSMLQQANRSLKTALALLRGAREIPGNDPDGRDLSIAVTHVEDALLRVAHGTPKDTMQEEATA